MLPKTLLPVLIAQSTAALSIRQDTTTLTPQQISSYKPYTYFSSAALCMPHALLTWSCGANCKANPGFLTTVAGGNGADIPYWFVGYDPSLEEIIVSHQGVRAEDLIADLTDADVFLTNLDPSLFPGISSNIEVHNGFQESHARSATAVLAAVKETASQHGATKVTIVGFSLGAAVALLDSVYLPLHLPTSMTFKTVTYGMPRVGNQAFADYIDANATLTHINNRKDPVPILPGRFLGYDQPAGEVHIQADGAWESCSGQENTSMLCTDGDVPDVFQGHLEDHSGPYDGVIMGC